jgi:hypothetical protein
VRFRTRAAAISGILPADMLHPEAGILTPIVRRHDRNAVVIRAAMCLMGKAVSPSGGRH